jgi:ribosomal protein L22
MKNALIYRKRMKKIIEEIPGDKLPEALDFLEYIKAKGEWEATWEILQDREFIEGTRKGKEDIREGRWKKWEELRRDV